MFRPIIPQKGQVIVVDTGHDYNKGVIVSKVNIFDRTFEDAGGILYNFCDIVMDQGNGLADLENPVRCMFMRWVWLHGWSHAESTEKIEKKEGKKWAEVSKEYVTLSMALEEYALVKDCEIYPDWVRAFYEAEEITHQRWVADRRKETAEQLAAQKANPVLNLRYGDHIKLEPSSKIPGKEEGLPYFDDPQSAPGFADFFAILTFVDAESQKSFKECLEECKAERSISGVYPLVESSHLNSSGFEEFTSIIYTNLRVTMQAVGRIAEAREEDYIEDETFARSYEAENGFDA